MSSLSNQSLLEIKNIIAEISLQAAKVIATEERHQKIVSKIEIKIKEFESSDLETSLEESHLKL